MAPPKRVNYTPNESDCLTLHQVIAQEETVIDTIRRLQREHETKRQLLAERANTLQRTLESTEILRETGSQLCTYLMPLLTQLQSQLAAQEADRTVVSAIFPSTSVFMHGWEVIKDGIAALDAALKRQLDRTQERITSIAQQLYSAESLRDQMSNSISSCSSMIDSAQQSIKFKKEGILHPVRRLPVEILLHIFEDCVNGEVDEYHRDPPRVFQSPPAMALRLASICSRWRDVMLGTPHLWRHLRAPTSSWYHPPSRGQFQNHLDRCRGGKVELTVPTGSEVLDDLSSYAITVQRLNLELAEGSDEWPILPSPVELWLYCPNAVSGWEIPSALISRTTHLTAWNAGISFQEDSRSLKRLELCGSQPAVNLTQILRQLPHLTDLDLIRAEMENAELLVLESVTHFHLQYLGLSHWSIDLLEGALGEGLHLSQLRHLELSDITSEYMATRRPFISAQLSATVVRLDFRGENTSLDAVRSFIDTFRRVNTIGCYGDVTETVLGAIYEVRTSQALSPGGETIRCTREIIHAMPKGLEVVVIRDYKGEGRKIDQQLRKMRQNPAADTQPVNVVFENCLNILPRIRREFAVSGPLIVVESADRDLGPGQSDCDPGDVNDWVLGRLEAADELSVQFVGSE
jgi:hypothetical protein